MVTKSATSDQPWNALLPGARLITCASPSTFALLLDHAGNPIRARLVACSATASFRDQLIAHIMGKSIASSQNHLADVRMHGDSGLTGLDRALAAHRVEQAGRAPVKTTSAPVAKPISELKGLAKAIAAHKTEPKYKKP